MRFGRTSTFAGSIAALALMSLISTCLGGLFHYIPPSLLSPAFSTYSSASALFFFGLSTLWHAIAMPSSKPSSSGKVGESEGLEEARQAVVSVSSRRDGFLVAAISTFGLVFTAEWGDKSMLSTIALAASSSPYGVAAGAIAGHALATGIAVVGGRLLSSLVSERVVTIFGGLLFLLFSALTVAIGF